MGIESQFSRLPVIHSDHSLGLQHRNRGRQSRRKGEAQVQTRAIRPSVRRGAACSGIRGLVPRQLQARAGKGDRSTQPALPVSRGTCNSQKMDAVAPATPRGRRRHRLVCRRSQDVPRGCLQLTLWRDGCAGCRRTTGQRSSFFLAVRAHVLMFGRDRHDKISLIESVPSRSRVFKVQDQVTTQP